MSARITGSNLKSNVIRKSNQINNIVLQNMNFNKNQDQWYIKKNDTHEENENKFH